MSKKKINATNKANKKKFFVILGSILGACAIVGTSVVIYGCGKAKPTPDTRRLKPLTFICEEDGADLLLGYRSSEDGFTIPTRDSINLSYQIDNGDWEPLIIPQKIGEQINYPIVENLKKGQEIHLRGSDNSYWNYHKEQVEPEYKYACEFLYFFNNNGKFSVANNIMSLIDDDFANLDTIPSDGCFRNLFCNAASSKSANIVDASDLILPAETLTPYCYYNMFNGCTNLVVAPELPATTLAPHCYDHMFIFCESLTKAPELPATTLADYCYYCMFYLCESLTKAPELPATTLAASCYNMMFKESELTEAPQLPASSLKDKCYFYMFNYCPLNITKNSGAHLIFVCPDTTGLDAPVEGMFEACYGESSDPITGASYYYN